MRIAADAPLDQMNLAVVTAVLDRHVLILVDDLRIYVRLAGVGQRSCKPLALGRILIGMDA